MKIHNKPKLSFTTLAMVVVSASAGAQQLEEVLVHTNLIEPQSVGPDPS